MDSRQQLASTLRRITLCSALLGTAFTVCPPEAWAADGASYAVTQNQNGTVKGKVIDQNGEPVIGATVKVDGQDKGAVTDLDGNFTINGVKSGHLTVTYIGYHTTTVNFTAGSPVTVTLKEDSKSLDEVVVVGFGVQKKSNLTGAVSVVDSKEFQARPVRTAAEALQGVVPGLNISSNSGSLDATPNITLRGDGTIGQGSSGKPLILIDGAEGDLNTINAQDIENISVLKDAAASSIYGSRAPFGVILVTTKKGKSGKITVNYNNSFRFSSLIRDKHMMNSYDFGAWMQDLTQGGQWTKAQFDKIVAYHNAKPYGPGSRITSDGQIIYSIDSSNGTTWDDGYAAGVNDQDPYDVLYKGTTFSQEHNASISGGTDKLNAYASFNFLDNGGFMKLGEDNMTRFNSTAKINAQIAKWLSVSYAMRYTRSDFEKPSYLGDGFYQNMARQGWPTLPVYDRNGYLYSSPSPYLGMAEQGQTNTQRDIINQQIGFVIEPIKNWVTHIDLTYKTDTWDTHTNNFALFNHNVAGEAVTYGDGNSSVKEEHKKENYLNFQAYSEYSLTVAKDHNFHIMGGFQAEQLKQTLYSAQRYGIIDPSKPELDLTTGLGGNGSPIAPVLVGNRNQWQTAGFFGRFNYNYADRYLLEANLRYDGSSQFQRNNMWRTFPSVSIGWNIANEKFFRPLQSKINTLKLRASYGSLGNQNAKDDTDWYRTYQTIQYLANNGTWLQNGTKPATTAAPGLVSALLTWEKIESYDIGLDFGAFNNRLTGSFDWYIRNTTDMVGNAPELPGILGTDVPKTNNTDLRTYGWELQVAWRDVLKNGLSYGVSVNLSDARSRIIRYPNNPTQSLSSYIAGRYYNEIWGYETIGIAKTDEEMNAHLATTDQSALGSSWAAGDIMYKDLNGDGKITSGSNTLNDRGDLKLLGNSTPRYFFGVDLNASWKGFDIRAFFQGVLKRDYFPSDARTFMFGSDSGGQWWAAGITGVSDYFRNENSWSVQNGYKSENLNAYLPRPLSSNKNLEIQSRYLLNAAYMRLKNFQLGYTIPRALTSQWGISNLRVYFSAENLFTVTSLPDQFDPELINLTYGNGYPLSRTYSHSDLT